MTLAVVEAPPQASAGRPSRHRRALLLGVVVVLLMGGLATFLSLRAHYRDAPPLSCACGLAWDQPDADRVRDTQAGPWSAQVVPARPGHVQAFEVLLINRSSVTQRVLAGDRDDGQTAEPVDVTFARPTGSVLRDQDAKAASDFAARSAVLAPGAARWVRYAIHTARHGLWTRGRTESFTALRLKVRVGAWTRYENVSFGDFAFVLQGT